MLTRREFGATMAMSLAAPSWKDEVARYLETLKKPDGGYGWRDDPDGQVTPSFFVAGCYGLLDREPPRKKDLAEFIRTHNPLPERRLKDRPLRRFWFEQIQALQWLGEDASSFRTLINGWNAPYDYPKFYELGGNPVFQHEVSALLCRKLLGLGVTEEWRKYILSKRRANATFNTTPAEDGSGGHVMNTWWGMQAMEALGQPERGSQKLTAWVQSCQLPGGGFTWAPEASPAGVDDVVYTWAALRILKAIGAEPPAKASCVKYLQSLRRPEGGFGDRQGRPANPMATYHALDSLRLLGAEPAPARVAAPKPARLPASLDVFTIQIEAPGNGSPSEAVEMAKALGIDIWAAKNSQPGWVERAQKIADERRTKVLFCVGNEEYGTYVKLPGLGVYSHLSDIVAPTGVDFGKPMADKTAVPWPVFRDQRIGALRKAGGCMIWQFNESEELTRILLDEAVERGTYAAIASFHFGNENFQHTQPFLMRYKDVLPFIALQDAHSPHSPWWWGDQLEGFRTVFLAKDPSWNSWMEALRENRVMAICRDARTNFETRYAGGTAPVRAVVSKWWDARIPKFQRPAAITTVIKPGDPFEPEVKSGVMIRVRCRWKNTTQGGPAEPVTELIRLTADGVELKTEVVTAKAANGKLADHYWRAYAEKAPVQVKAETRKV